MRAAVWRHSRRKCNARRALFRTPMIRDACARVPTLVVAFYPYS
jgi:hypothetical protein